MKPLTALVIAALFFGCSTSPTKPDANGVYWERGPEGWELRVQNPDGSTRPAKSGPVGGQFGGT